MDLALVLSIISILIAAATLFLTHLRPPKIALSTGPGIKVYYTKGGGLSFYIPITFVNTGPRTGTLLRMSLTLFRRDTPEVRYLLPWRSFSKFEPGTNSWVFQEIAHAIAVPGKAALAKTIWFSWPEDSDDKPILREGAYVVTLHKYFHEQKPPLAEQHELIMSSKDINILEGYRAHERSTTIDVVLDRKLSDHRVLTQHEYEKLLSG